MSLFGYGVSQDRLLEIRDMPEMERRNAIGALIVENGGGSRTLWGGNQFAVAYKMVEALVDGRRTGISGAEVKRIIAMAKDCW